MGQESMDLHMCDGQMDPNIALMLLFLDDNLLIFLSVIRYEFTL